MAKTAHQNSDFWSSESGAVMPLFALMLLVLLFSIGIGVDYTRFVNVSSRMQASLDAAVLAASKIPDDEKVTTAQNVFVQNFMADLGITAADVATTFNSPTDGVVSGTASAQLPTTFSRIMNISSLTVRVNSTATRGSTVRGMPTCVLALDATMSNQIVVSGGGKWIANDCTVWQNSSSSNAVTFSGGSTLTSGKNCFHGQVSQGAISPWPIDCGQKPDPFAGMTWSSPPACDYTNFTSKGGAFTLSPGVYCGGMALSGGPDVTLSPGTYYIRNGKLSMSGGGSMTGTGVTFVIEGSSAVDLSGGGSYHLVAPASGQFASFLFFQDPAGTGTKANMSGGGGLYYEGVIYFPNQEVVVSGGGVTSTPSPFTVYLGRNFTYSGSSNLLINADASATSVPIPDALYDRYWGAPRLTQ